MNSKQYLQPNTQLAAEVQQKALTRMVRAFCKYTLLWATPHKYRLEALHVIYLQIFRYLAQNLFDICQCFTKSLIWIETQMPLGYASMPASILYNLTKNLTSHLTHNLCAVLPMIFLQDLLPAKPHHGYLCFRHGCSLLPGKAHHFLRLKALKR